MKKYLFIVLFLLIFGTHANAQAPWDLIYHAIPVTTGPDIPEEIKQIGGNLQTTVSQTKKMIMTAKTDASNIQTAVISTFNKIKSGAILDLFGNPGQNQAGFCGRDVTKVKTKKISKKIKNVLLVAKSKDLAYLNEQKRNKEKFYMDNIYAIHAASLIIRQEVENDIKAQVDKAMSCAKGSGSECGIPSTDEGGNNEAIFTYGKTLEAMDSVVRLWESVAALKARLAAVKMIHKLTPAVDPGAEDEDESAGSDEQAMLNMHESFSKFHSTEQIGFAQIDTNFMVDNAEKTSLDDVEAAATIKEEADAIQSVVGRVNFVSPEMSEKEHPLAGVQVQMEALEEMNEAESLVADALNTHNIIKDLPQYKDRAELYQETQEDYKKTLEKLKKSESCAIKYLSKYFTEPHMVWSGKLPLENADKHKFRKGISGWALSAFEVLKSGEATDVISAYETVKEKRASGEQEDAYDKLVKTLTDKIDQDTSPADFRPDQDDQDALQKAMEDKVNKTMSTSGTQPQEVAQETLTAEDVAKYEDDPDFKKSEERNSAENNNKLVKEAMAPGKKDSINEEARKSSLYSWQIGAEASKMLGDPQYDWGSAPTGNKFIWTDTKRFYKKYLKKKYDNILRYMKSYSKADVLYLVAQKLHGNMQRANASSYQTQRAVKLDELNNTAKQELDGAINTKKSERATFLAGIGDLKKQKDAITKQTDVLNAKLRLLKDKINNIKANKEDKNIKDMSKALATPVSYYPKDDNGNPIPLDLSAKKVKNIDRDKISSDLKEGTSKNIAEDKDIQKIEKEITLLQKQINEKVSDLDAKEIEIKKRKLKEQEDKAPSDEVSGANNAEKLLKANIDTMLQGLHATEYDKVFNEIKGILTAGNTKNPIEGFVIDSVMNGIDAAAKNLVNLAHKEAERIINNGLAKIDAMGDDLYLESKYDELKSIHDKIISDLIAVKLTYTLAETAADSLLSPLFIIRDLEIFKDFLDGIDTSPETEGFFVGMTPKERDLRAPHKLSGFNLPPVREVFHFDAIDYTHVKPEQQKSKGEGKGWLKARLAEKKRRYVPKEDFLSGRDVPKIWKLILSDYPFIESRLPLNEILTGEDASCENLAFARGGTLPCLYGNSTKVLDVDQSGKYIHYSAGNDDKNLSECSSIKIREGNPYHSFWKVDLSVPMISIMGFTKISTGHSRPERNCEYSELGMLFEADQHNNLYIREIPFANFNRINNRDGGSLDSMGDVDKRDLAAAKLSELGRNQIGDFLKHAEREKISKETLEEIKSEYDRGMQTVYNLFSEQGFTPSKDFNLAKAGDYKQAEKVLKDVKAKKIAKAVSVLNAIDISDNPPAQEKSKNLKKLIDIMTKDTKSVLKLSMVDADSNDLQARLIKATADKALSDKYNENAKKKKEEAGDVEEVFCAIY